MGKFFTSCLKHKNSKQENIINQNVSVNAPEQNPLSLESKSYTVTRLDTQNSTDLKVIKPVNTASSPKQHSNSAEKPITQRWRERKENKQLKQQKQQMLPQQERKELQEQLQTQMQKDTEENFIIAIRKEVENTSRTVKHMKE